MSSRTTKLVNAHLHAAEAYAELSHATRSKVGAVIVKDHHIISVGYNGMPSGWANDCEVDGITKREVLHAESNAIAFAARNGLATEGCELVTTMSPCFECAKLILQAGIKKVYYKELYRDAEGITFLQQSNIEVEHVRD